MPLLKKEIHRKVYLFGIILLVVSISLSNFFMSMAQFLLVANWLAEGNFNTKWEKIKTNKALWFFLTIYLIHIIGLFYTYDFSFAFLDLKIKLPLLLLPVLFVSSEPLTFNEVKKVLLFHVASNLIASIICLSYFYISQVNDIRQISLFVSHIRFSLNICLDIFFLLFFIFREPHFKKGGKTIFILTVAWFIYFLVFSESFTGITILFASSIIILTSYIIAKARLIYRLALILLIILISTLGSLYVDRVIRDYYKNQELVNPYRLEFFTKYGNPYIHDLKNLQTENGHRTYIYLCEKEMQPAWESRSRIKYNGKDKNGQPLKFTLMRYLSSRGFRKDYDGVMALSNEDILSVENGVANIEYRNNAGFTTRIKKTIWEYENYKNTGNIQGSSIIQRFELWNISLKIIKDYFFIGVGTGDAANVFYAKMFVEKSPLANVELRSHNQFFTIAIAFGIIGLFLFIIALFVPPILIRQFRNSYFLAFFLIAFFSMLSEDTLETQAGVTFFAFFSAFFLFAIGKNKKAI
jgi:hypothetical protein